MESGWHDEKLDPLPLCYEAFGSSLYKKTVQEDLIFFINYGVLLSA
jgi:hypothetical protein